MTDHPGENPTGPAGEERGQPEGSATPPPTPPPAAPPPASAPTPPSAASGDSANAPGAARYDMASARTALEGANRLDLGIIAAGLVAFIASLLPFYTISVFGASGSVSAWHGFFGWFGVLVALATSVAVALAVFGVVKLPMPVHQVAAGGFGLALLCLLIALFVDPGGGCGGAGAFGVHCDIGRGFGYWLALLAALAGTGLAVVRMRETTATTTAS